MTNAQEKLKEALINAGMPEDKASVQVSAYNGNSWGKGIINHTKLSPRPIVKMLCPNCGGKMVDVLLIGDREAKYCPYDRVVVPLPVESVDNSVAFETLMKSTLATDKSTASMFASSEKLENQKRYYNY